MLWLYDADRALLGALPEYESSIETFRYSEFGDLNAKLPLSAYPLASQAKYATVGDSLALWTVDAVEEATEGVESFVTLTGREATVVLERRTIEGTMTWTATPAGAVIRDIIESFTGPRALPVVFGTGDTLGDDITIQRSWGDAAETVREIATSAGLGLTATLDGTNIVVSVIEPTDAGTFLGEVYGNGSAARKARDESGWRNYAIVLGEQPEAAFIAATTHTLVAGSTNSGTSANVDVEDNVTWVIAEDVTNGITTEHEFTVPAGATAGEFLTRSYYTGSPAATHHMDLEAYDYVAGAWEEILSPMVPSGGSVLTERRAPFFERHINRSTNRAKFRQRHHVTSPYVTSHRFHIDRVAASFAAARTRVDVDLTGTEERRELYVDARDLQSDADGVTLTPSEYAAVLTQRGREKLAETRVVEYAEATVSTPLSVGSVAWYDSGRWQVQLMCSEATRTTEGGGVKYGALFGEPPTTLRKTLRRATS